VAGGLAVGVACSNAVGLSRYGLNRRI